MARHRFQRLAGRTVDRRYACRRGDHRDDARRAVRRGALPVRADGAARHRARRGAMDFARRGNRGTPGIARQPGRGAVRRPPLGRVHDQGSLEAGRFFGRVTMATIGTAGVSTAAARVGRYRWVICGLLFAATAVNYVDRQMIGLLKPLLSQDLHWSENDYSNIVFWFQAAYAIGYLAFGKVIDLIGARLGYAVAVVIWTIAHVAHGGVLSVCQFAMARFGLGIGESGNFPGGVKAVTAWFPARERALAIGIFNAGSNVGAIVAPLLMWLLVPLIGWRGTFVATGILGEAWMIYWLTYLSD